MFVCFANHYVCEVKFCLARPSSSHHGNTGRPRRDRGRPRTATWSVHFFHSKVDIV